jgi:hypothetical protein
VTESQKEKSASNGKAEVLKILTENLTAGAKVAKRLLWSCERVAHLLPLAETENSVDAEQANTGPTFTERYGGTIWSVADRRTADQRARRPERGSIV